MGHTTPNSPNSKHSRYCLAAPLRGVGWSVEINTFVLKFAVHYLHIGKETQLIFLETQRSALAMVRLTISFITP
jgi:hypothetical protein